MVNNNILTVTNPYSLNDEQTITYDTTVNGYQVFEDSILVVYFINSKVKLQNLLNLD